MIDTALNFLTTRLNDHVNGELNISGNSVVLTNASNGDSISIPDKTMGVSLVNIEEERIFKQQQTKFLTEQGTYEFREPELKLNLYILISANYVDEGGDGNTSGNYLEGLKRISLVIGYFQSHNVFTWDEWPALDNHGIGKLIVDLYSYSFEQMYNFWSVLGISYLPSVLYKVRLLKVQTYKEDTAAAPVSKVGITTNHRT